MLYSRCVAISLLYFSKLPQIMTMHARLCLDLDYVCTVQQPEYLHTGRAIAPLCYSTPWQAFLCNHDNFRYLAIIPEHLSARLLFLQSVLSVGKVWPQLPSCLGMQLKVWLVCKHPSHLEGNSIKYLFTKRCVHLHKFVVSSTVMALVVSLLRHQNGTKL